MKITWEMEERIGESFISLMDLDGFHVSTHKRIKELLKKCIVFNLSLIS